MRIIRVDRPNALERAVREAVAVLRGGGIVAYPTDTFYGLAVDPRRDDAVERLFAAKERDAGAAVPLIAADLDQARSVGIFGEIELRIADRFWPGPLTIVAAADPILSSRLLAGGRTVAIRVPAHEVARQLAAGLGFCVTATSANISGGPSVADVKDIDAELAANVDVTLDAGPTPGGAPSTIVEVDAGALRLVRAGAIAWERVLKSLE